MTNTKPITTNKKWSIIITAAVFDGLGMIPFVGVILNALGYIVIYSWLWLYGLSPVQAFRKGKTNWLWFVVEWGLYFTSFSFVPGLTLNAFSSVSVLEVKE